MDKEIKLRQWFVKDLQRGTDFASGSFTALLRDPRFAYGCTKGSLLKIKLCLDGVTKHFLRNSRGTREWID